MRERCVTPRWVDKAKASTTRTGGRSRMDAVRAGSVTQWELRRNLEDRWLPGMSLTTSAGMGSAWPELAREAAINRQPDASLCPPRAASASAVAAVARSMAFPYTHQSPQKQTIDSSVGSNRSPWSVAEEPPGLSSRSHASTAWRCRAALASITLTSIRRQRLSSMSRASTSPSMSKYTSSCRSTSSPPRCSSTT